MEMFIDGTTLGSLKVLEVYEYYDGPRLFASVNGNGSVFLCAMGWFHWQER